MKRDRVAVLLPTLLLFVVAFAQMLLARTSLMSPWKGGGFGMFASVDGLPFRSIRIYVTAADRSEELAVPASLEDEARRLATWPRQPSLQAFAQSVVDREQRRSRPVESVRVEVWRAALSRTLELSEHLIAQTTARAHASASSSDR